LPKKITNSVPWIISSPANFVNKQLKRTNSLPLVGGMQRKVEPVKQQIKWSEIRTRCLSVPISSQDSDI